MGRRHPMFTEGWFDLAEGFSVTQPLSEGNTFWWRLFLFIPYFFIWSYYLQVKVDKDKTIYFFQQCTRFAQIRLRMVIFDPVWRPMSKFDVCRQTLTPRCVPPLPFERGCVTLKPSGKSAFCEHQVPSAHQQCVFYCAPLCGGVVSG